MTADIWAYSELAKTSFTEYKNEMHKSPHEDIFNIVMVESGYKDAEEVHPHIMDPFVIGEIYKTTENSTVYNSILGDYDRLLAFLTSLTEFVDDLGIDSDEDPFFAIGDIVETDTFIGTIECAKLAEAFSKYDDRFTTWSELRGDDENVRLIYRSMKDAFAIGSDDGCVIVG